MKTFWKVFAVSFVFFAIVTLLGSYSYMKTKGVEEDFDFTLIGGAVGNEDIAYEEEEAKKDIEEIEDNTKTPREAESFNSLKEAFYNSKRINAVLLGMEDVRTDTIIFASFDPDTKEVNLFSVPRDTYIHRKGYDLAEQRKINAIYESHGIEGVKKAVSYLFQGAPIHFYVKIDYEGVKKIVDSIGGVEVVVPFDMKYDDPTADPPLHIDLKAGRQLLDGEKALQFIRYRKGNTKKQGYIDGDLGRIKDQQEFIKSFINKAISYRLPVVIKNGYPYVETDIGLFEALYYGGKALGIKMEDIKFETLPGRAEFRRYGGTLLSYYIANLKETRRILEEIYNVKPPKN